MYLHLDPNLSGRALCSGRIEPFLTTQPDSSNCPECAAAQLWRDYCATHTLPDDVPAHPDQVYAGQWQGWVDWIGGQS